MGGRVWFDAETMYLTLYNANPDNLQLAQQLAMFYMSPGYPRARQGQQGHAAGKQGAARRCRWQTRSERSDPDVGPPCRGRAAGGDAANINSCSKPQNLLASNSRDGELAGGGSAADG